MRDQHRSKQDLISEVVALRKQTADLRETMVAHRRLEEALRQSEEKLRALTDGAPVGLCLVRGDGMPLAANRPFARLLGYDSPAELLRVGQVLGVFTQNEELSRLVRWIDQGNVGPMELRLRRKSGELLACWALGAARQDSGAVALAIVEPVNVAWSAGTGPASVQCNA